MRAVRGTAGHRAAKVLVLAGLAAVGGPAGLGLAQDANPALTLDLGVGFRLNDGDLVNRNSIDIVYSTRTRDQSLELSLGTDFEGAGDEDDLFPKIGVDYERDTGVLMLSLSADYERREVDGSIPGPDFDFDSSDLIEDDGTQDRTTLAFDAEIGRRAPVGLEFGARFRGRDYQGTDDPDLTDERNLRYTSALRLTVDPTLAFRLTALRELDKEDGGRDSVETGYGVRASWTATPTTELDFALVRTRIEEERRTVSASGEDTRERTGLTGEVEMTRDMQNGTLGLSFERRLNDNGDTDRLRLTRDLSLANGGDLSLAVGAARFEDADTQATFDIRYNQPLPVGTLTAVLRRDASVDSDDQNIVRTRASIGHQRPLTPLSDLSISVGFAAIDIVDGNDSDRTATNLRVGYSRNVGRNWNLDLGYRGTVTREDDGDDDSDSVLSLNLNRSFTFLP